MIGVERARKAMEDAELVLVLSDAVMDDPEADELAETLHRQGKSVVRIFTKQDLTDTSKPRCGRMSVPMVSVSSVTGAGFDALRDAVEQVFIDGELRMGEEAVVFSARQAAALRETIACLDTAADNLDAGLPYDICADDIRAAMNQLGGLCGREMGEDVLTEIFSRFCVGK
jgi:tRNA modification GTPase